MYRAIDEMRTESALAKAREIELILHEMEVEPEKIAEVVNESVELVKEWLAEPL